METYLLDRLQSDDPLVCVELRPPRSGMSYEASMDVWIDMYHSIQRLVRRDTIVFLTDNAVGQSEEENLGHLTANLTADVSLSRIVPFLTSKHTLEYCQMYAARAASSGFGALTVLGGDQSVGPARCVPHSYELRRVIRDRVPDLTLGGWVNPYQNPSQQVDFLLQHESVTDFYLAQIVSHHDLQKVEAFLAEARRRGVNQPGVFGVFMYRSANPRTLKRLAEFFPVPFDGVTKDFGAGLSAEGICAKTIAALRDVGADKVYVSNLAVGKAAAQYRSLVDATSSVR